MIIHTHKCRPVDQYFVVLPDGHGLVNAIVGHRIDDILFAFEELLDKHCVVALAEDCGAAGDVVPRSPGLLKCLHHENAVGPCIAPRLHHPLGQPLRKDKVLDLLKGRGRSGLDGSKAAFLDALLHGVFVPPCLSEHRPIGGQAKLLTEKVVQLHSAFTAYTAGDDVAGQSTQTRHDFFVGHLSLVKFVFEFDIAFANARHFLGAFAPDRNNRKATVYNLLCQHAPSRDGVNDNDCFKHGQ
mmetsp:Transcript_107718/g.246718  ORF Transcript_107718/g.246718 Transcript_107718/m.246718 type:complete len:241 (-) Transcript_107718:254-976(-)